MPQAGGLNSGNVFSCSSKGWKPKTKVPPGLGLVENFWLRMPSFCFLCPHVHGDRETSASPYSFIRTPVSQIRAPRSWLPLALIISLSILSLNDSYRELKDFCTGTIESVKVSIKFLMNKY